MLHSVRFLGGRQSAFDGRAIALQTGEPGALLGQLCLPAQQRLRQRRVLATQGDKLALQSCLGCR